MRDSYIHFISTSNLHPHEFLVEWGIESMSLNPDTMIKTRLAAAEIEKKLKKKVRNKSRLSYSNPYLIIPKRENLVNFKHKRSDYFLF